MAAQIPAPPSSPVPAPPPLAEVSPSKVVELYCTCRQPEHGDMMACVNEECPSPDEWYHVDCVCLDEVIDKWYSTSCEALGKKKKKKSKKRVGGPSGSAAVELSGEQTINMHSMIEALGGHRGVQDWFYMLPHSYTGYRVTQKVVSTAAEKGKCSPPMVAAVAFWTECGSSAVVGTELRARVRTLHTELHDPATGVPDVPVDTGWKVPAMATVTTMTMMLGAVAHVMGMRGRRLNNNIIPPLHELSSTPISGGLPATSVQ